MYVQIAYGIMKTKIQKANILTVKICLRGNGGNLHKNNMLIACSYPAESNLT